MSQSESQTLEQATSAIQVDAQPDNKTRRYDRQLRSVYFASLRFVCF